jgi:hypothetical protein
MNAIIQVSLAFIQLIIAAKIVFYRNVIAAMTGNTAFPTPPTSLADFTTQVDLVETKANNVAAARTALVQAEWELQEEADQMDLMGRALAGYVQGASMGDPGTLESSGFSLKAQRQPVGVLPPPSNLRAEPGQEGTCELRCNTQRGGRLYEMECAPQVTGPYVSIYKGTRAKCLATGLTSGTQYWFRARVFGAAGPSDWSDAVTKRAP